MASTTVKPPSSKNSTGDNNYAFGMQTVYPMKMTGAGIIITTAVLVFIVCLIIILKIIHLLWTPGGKTPRRRKKSTDAGVPWLKRMSMKLTRRNKSPTDGDHDATDRTVSMTLSEKEAESRSDTPTVTANTKNNKRMSVQSNWSVVSHIGKVAFGKNRNKSSKKEKGDKKASIKEKQERKGSKKDKGDANKDSDKGKMDRKESVKEKRRESKKEKSERKLSKKKSTKDRMMLSKHLSTLPGEVPPVMERKLSIP